MFYCLLYGCADEYWEIEDHDGKSIDEAYILCCLHCVVLTCYTLRYMRITGTFWTNTARTACARYKRWRTLSLNCHTACAEKRRRCNMTSSL